MLLYTHVLASRFLLASRFDKSRGIALMVFFIDVNHQSPIVCTNHCSYLNSKMISYFYKERGRLWWAKMDFMVVYLESGLDFKFLARTWTLCILWYRFCLEPELYIHSNTGLISGLVLYLFNLEFIYLMTGWTREGTVYLEAQLYYTWWYRLRLSSLSWTLAPSPNRGLQTFSLADSHSGPREPGSREITKNYISSTIKVKNLDNEKFWLDICIYSINRSINLLSRYQGLKLIFLFVSVYLSSTIYIHYIYI